MSMDAKPIYAVTFCGMDEKTDSSWFWHTSILLTFFQSNQMEVTDYVGFYGLPIISDQGLSVASSTSIETTSSIAKDTKAFPTSSIPLTQTLSETKSASVLESSIPKPSASFTTNYSQSPHLFQTSTHALTPLSKFRHAAITQVKKRIKLPLATGAHGLLCREEIRFLERGKGLHGKTFEITEPQYRVLQKRFVDRMAEERAAIDEIVKDLKARGLKLTPKTKFKHYPYENYGDIIYKEEKERAAREHRRPRLHRFELSLFGERDTCKNQGLKLLEGILTPSQIKSLENNHPSITRWSGPLENIHLHSKGEAPPLQHKSPTSGKITHYRDASKDKTVKIYWSLPPQLIEPLSEKSCDIFKIHKDYVTRIKKVISQLQQLEWLFRNAQLHIRYTKHKQQLIDLIVAHYEAFSLIKPKPIATKTGLIGVFSWLVSQPRNTEEAQIMINLALAETLINNLYSAIADGHTLDTSIKLERQQQKIIELHPDIKALAAHLTPEDQQQFRRILEMRAEIHSDIEALAAYLSPEDQQQFCFITHKKNVTPTKSERLSARYAGLS